ncbi:MAG TPA: glyoxalase/bleomycin resistance/extradiol dioxygenase family protein [Microscillaceae bacterium]|nr:glyoxalase/bleomycin resistance/extradiol dioxygenase family protein [Microscillaceae bacterium]
MNLNQITVSTHDIVQSVTFYKTLGLELIVDAPHYARFLVPEGRATFSVSLTEEPIQTKGTTVYFECENLDAKVEELLAKGLEFTEQPTDKSWLWREAHLLDPAGNVICLYYAGENRVNPPWRVESS